MWAVRQELWGCYMLKHLIDFWILNEEGRIISRKAGLIDPDDQSVGKLISALYNYTQNRFDDRLRRFTTDKHQYYIIEQQRILFTGKFPRNITFKEKIILKDMHQIQSKFFERFTKEDLKNSDLDINELLEL